MASPTIPLTDLVVGRAFANYINVAATTLFVYDTILTFDAEVKHIWSRQWSFGRISFHFNRIWGLLIVCITGPVTFGYSFSLTTCRSMTGLYGYGVLFLVLNITCVMILRAWIIYDQRKLVLFPLGFICTTFVIVCIVDLGFQVTRMELLPNPAPELVKGCLITIPTGVTRIPYIVTFTFDTGLFFLCIGKIWTLTRSGSGSPLVSRLARDGTIYYLLHSASFGCAIVGVRLGISGYLLPLHATLCTRMILSLRAYESEALPTTRIKNDPRAISLGIITPATTAQNGTTIELGDATTFSRGTSQRYLGGTSAGAKPSQ